MLDLIERSVRSAWTARSPVLYLGNKLVYLMYSIWKRDERAGVRPGLRIALRALHRSEAPGLRRPRRRSRERSRDLFGRGDDLPHHAVARVHEALLDRAGEQLEERREESARVHHHDGIQIQPEALERDGFQQLLERAGAPGQGDRGLTQAQHHVLAGAQVLDQLQVAQPLVTPLEIGHEARQDADHVSALAECAIGQRAPGAGGAAAVADPNTL